MLDFQDCFFVSVLIFFNQMQTFNDMALMDISRYYSVQAFRLVLVIKNPSANAGDARDASSIPGLGRSPGEGTGNPFRYSCLENPMDRDAWWATIHRVTKCLIQLNQPSTHTPFLFSKGRIFDKNKCLLLLLT